MKELNLSDKIVEDGDFVRGTKVVSVQDVKEAVLLIKKKLKEEFSSSLSEDMKIENIINDIFGNELI